MIYVALYSLTMRLIRAEETSIIVHPTIEQGTTATSTAMPATIIVPRLEAT